MKPAPALRVLPHAENTPRHPGRRLQAAPAQGKTRSRLLAAAGLGSPLSATQKAAPERWNDKAIRLPPSRGERYPTPPPVTHPSLGGRLGHREGVGENDARHRIDRLARSLALEEEDDVGPPCFGPRIRDEPFPKGFSLPRDMPKYNGSVKPEDWPVDYSTMLHLERVLVFLEEERVMQQ